MCISFNTQTQYNTEQCYSLSVIPTINFADYCVINPLTLRLAKTGHLAIIFTLSNDRRY